MISFTLHRASRQFVANGAVEMRGLLHPINVEGTSTVGNLGRASTLSKPLPTPLSSPAGYIAEGSRRFSPVARPRHFSIVIARLRRLASVFLLRLPQPPRLSRNEEPRLIQISLSGLYRAIQPAKQPRCGLSQCLQPALPCSVSPRSNLARGALHGTHRNSANGATSHE